MLSTNACKFMQGMQVPESQYAIPNIAYLAAVHQSSEHNKAAYAALYTMSGVQSSHLGGLRGAAGMVRRREHGPRARRGGHVAHALGDAVEQAHAEGQHRRVWALQRHNILILHHPLWVISIQQHIKTQ